MSIEELNQEPLDVLPNELDGYQLRLFEMGYFVLEYSKRPMFGRYANPEYVSEDELEENLLFDAKADTLEEAVEELRNKIRDYRADNLK